MAELRSEVDAWLTAHETGEFTLADLAALEGLNARRDTVVRELQKAEARLIESLIRRMREQNGSAQTESEPA